MNFKKLVIAMVGVAALVLSLALTIPSSSHAATSARAATASTTVQCVHLTGHNNWLCVASGGPGVLYWTDNLYTRQFYWHPASGDQTAMEQFFCQNDQHSANGHPTCISNAPGVPANTPEWNRRVISLAGGCTVYSWPVLDTNSHPAAPTHCTLPNGTHRNLTPTEQRSVLGLWHTMLQVAGSW